MNLNVDRRTFLGAGAAGLGYFFTAPAYSARRAAASRTRPCTSPASASAARAAATSTRPATSARSSPSATSTPAGSPRRRRSGRTAKTFDDYRDLLDAMGKEIDAVTVSTPDHNHALASLLAIRMGKHVYCQKPLTHTVFEARVLKEAAKQHGVCTQMGNQGSAENGLRRAVELVQGGIIGPVREAHVWTNRPIWPQAPAVTEPARQGRRPGGETIALGPVHRRRPAPAVRPGGLPPVQLAGLVGLRHRRHRRHGLPHRQHGLPRPEARAPDRRLGRERRGQPRDLPGLGPRHDRVPGPRGHAAGDPDLVRGPQGRQARPAARGAAGEDPLRGREAAGQRLDPRRREGHPLLAERLRRQVPLPPRVAGRGQEPRASPSACRSTARATRG